MGMAVERLNAFWAKTPRGAPGSAGGAETGAPYKPISHHLLDVAAAALALQKAAPARLAREAADWRAPPEDVARMRALWAGLHDLGKFSRAFQAKAPEHWPETVLGPKGDPPSASHGLLTARLLRDGEIQAALKALLPRDLEPSDWCPLIDAVGGHHGAPLEAGKCTALGLRDAHALVGSPALDAAREMVAVLSRLLAPPPMTGIGGLEQVKRLTWGLAGLTTAADWAGSDAAYFPFEPIAMAPDDYWPLALGRAEGAIAAKGLRPARPAASSGLAQVFPALAAHPRPMQAAADAAPLAEGPLLAILEDATGAGKTEAALALASRMIAAGKGEGVYVALPTMATANAMFERLAPAHRALFAPETPPSLALAHGKSALSPLFQKVRAADPSVSGAGGGVAAACAEWIADDRRKAFFAEIGTGTIDQALLSVLPKRFLALRQYGLAGKVLIIDEAHAYDIYTSGLMQTLLSFHAAAGGSAIVLSATLPRQLRAQLLAAFAAGGERAADSAPAPGRTAYPLLTLAGRETLIERGVDPVPATVRRVAVHRLDTVAAAEAEALRAAAAGAAVLWVRNAVDDASAAATALRAAGATVDLFHARFAMVDRLRHEAAALGRFGKDADPAERRGRILVSTQVCEQSLDLDFDAMITDLAPVDAIIQRAGRLWRHMDRRPASERPVAGPALWLLTADPDRVEGEGWLRQTQEKGGWVYPNAGVLWRTARALCDAGAIDAPGGLRPLIERVYGEADVPPALEQAQRKALGEDSAQSTLADWNGLALDEGYPAVTGVASDQEIGTRLGSKTKTLRVALWAEDRLVPWAAAAEPDRRRAWALSELSCRETWLRGLAPPTALAAPLAQARADWPDWDQTEIAVVADRKVLLVDEAGNAPLTYDAETGLKRRSSPVRG